MSYIGPLRCDIFLVWVLWVVAIGAGKVTGMSWQTTTKPVRASVAINEEIQAIDNSERNSYNIGLLQYAPAVQPCSPVSPCTVNNTICSTNGVCICKEGFLLSFDDQCEPEIKKKNPGLFAVLLIVAGCVIATLIAVAIVCHFKRCYDPTTARGFQISQELLTTDNRSIEAPPMDDKPPSYDQVIQSELLQTIPPPNYVEATSRRCTAISCVSQDSLPLNEPAVLWVETTAIVHRMRESCEQDMALPPAYVRTPSLEIPLLSSLGRLSHASLCSSTHLLPGGAATSDIPKIPTELRRSHNKGPS